MKGLGGVRGMGSYRAEGICTGWHWIGSHWASRRDMKLYRRPSHRDYSRGYIHARLDERGFRRGHEHGHEHGEENRHGHR